MSFRRPRVLSVGRVQTPVLALVVRRDEEIAAFVSRPFYEVLARIPHEGCDIKAKWKPSDACAPYQDEEGRVIHRALAENVSRRIEGQPATVQESRHRTSSESAPLPYSLSALQIDAARLHGLSAANVLAACQRLYETHKLITYPRSDCRYLPSAHFSDAEAVRQAIRGNAASLESACAGADLALKSKAWDDAKVGAHHAIVPTAQSLRGARLSASEAQVYELVARRYLMQFYKPATYREGRLQFEIAGGTFVASGKEPLSPGWRALEPPVAASKRGRASQAPPAYLPPLRIGAVLTCEEGIILDKKTQPPKPFTDATLLQAITGIARYVRDPGLRKILRESDGIGTEATRAHIIEVLFKRKFLARVQKQIRATEAGKTLIRALPDHATAPDMTAHWDLHLRSMAEQKHSYDAFMSSLEAELTRTVGAG